MNKIEELVKEIDFEMNQIYLQYCDLHKELDAFRGALITPEVEQDINRIIAGIQDTFAEMYPACMLIAQRHNQVINVVNNYHEFIKQLKEAGATEHKVEKSITH